MKPLQHTGIFSFSRKPLACEIPESEREQQSRLDEVTDRIKERFGKDSLQRALGMLHSVEHRSGPPGADRNQYGK
jgi:hypothetical protein